MQSDTLMSGDACRYAYLGDCVVVGAYTPPPAVSVLRDVVTPPLHDRRGGGRTALSPLAKPIGFEKVSLPED